MKPRLSFACIAHKSEAHHVMRMVTTLPGDAELIVLWNEQGDNQDVVERKIVELKNGLTVKYYETQWHELDFATLRNISIGLCSAEWIMWIDADDRLLIHQHEFFDELANYPQGVGGLVCGCVGSQPKHDEKGEILRYHTPQVRIFRNGRGFFFEGSTHEQVSWSIERDAFRIDSCSLLVHHVGYEITADAMTKKLQRNVKGLARAIVGGSDQAQLEYWTRVLLRDSSSLNYYFDKEK